MSFFVNNRIFVNPGFEDEFEERFRRRAGEIDKQPGFVAMRVLRPLGNQAPYVVETQWESQAAFRAWVGSDDTFSSTPVAGTPIAVSKGTPAQVDAAAQAAEAAQAAAAPPARAGQALGWRPLAPRDQAASLVTDQR